jgi:cytochrome c553
MIVSSNSVAAVLAVSLFAFTASAQAGDIEAGAEKAKVCAACHGADFKSPIDPSYAILAGQHEDYLVASLKAYKSGQRKNAIMGAQAGTLSADDIDNLSAYFASLPGPMGYKKYSD